MALRIVGAGLPRTGTTSLKTALEQLLGAPCYHMRELAGNLDHAMSWRDAFDGNPPDWAEFLAGYAAGVDWPVSWFWRELAATYPDAVVLLSHRASPERWYQSMDRTVLAGARRLHATAARSGPDGHGADGHQEGPSFLADATPQQRRAMEQMSQHMFGIFSDPDDPAAVMAYYQQHLAEVRSTIPADRLLEWQPGDGWEPICTALGVPVPDEPFPHRNTTAEMVARVEASQ